jgi:hypothetical protein
LKHVDDFPELPSDNPLLTPRQPFEPKKPEPHAVPILTDSNVSQSPQWSDRFRQLRRSIQGRSLKNSVSPAKEQTTITVTAELPPTKTRRSKSKAPPVVAASPYDVEPSPPPQFKEPPPPPLKMEEPKSRREIPIEQPASKRRQMFRRSRSVANGSLDSRKSNEPLVTHFPVDVQAPITHAGWVFWKLELG